MNINETTIKIYCYIKNYIKEHNYSPSMREVQKMIKLKSPATVKYHINKLIDLGFIKVDYDKKGTIIARSIKITNSKENDIILKKISELKEEI